MHLHAAVNSLVLVMSVYVLQIIWQKQHWRVCLQACKHMVKTFTST